jgi:hypothetical protein
MDFGFPGRAGSRRMSSRLIAVEPVDGRSAESSRQRDQATRSSQGWTSTRSTPLDLLEPVAHPGPARQRFRTVLAVADRTHSLAPGDQSALIRNEVSRVFGCVLLRT